MITVIDNALADPLFKSIKDIVDHRDFPWHLGNDIDDTNMFDKGTQTKQLTHLLFSNIKNWGNDSSLFDMPSATEVKRHSQFFERSLRVGAHPNKSMP